jgi:hypothetical protein
MNVFNKDFEDRNKNRLKKLIDLAKKNDSPTGWETKTFAVGGLTEVGFSMNNPELLLVISSQGRGVINCSEFKLTDRDTDIDGDWINYIDLVADGIGELRNEIIKISGLHGGGLPLTNEFGDSLQMVAPEWPIFNLIFEPNYTSIFIEKSAKDCFQIFRDYELRAYGFSSNGKFFITATSSEVNIYRKKA